MDDSPVIDADQLWNKRAVIAELADIIIPASETPGAKEAGVENYIIKVLLSCHNAQEQRQFYSGLLEVEKYTINAFKKDFLSCSSTEKNLVLTHFSQTKRFSSKLLSKIEIKLVGRSFYTIIKKLTVDGYCQSNLGATLGLAYDYIPEKFQPCTTLEPDQRSWATK